MNKKLTVAIYGAGARGSHYARCCQEFADEIEVVAIADLKAERVAELAEELHIPREN